MKAVVVVAAGAGTRFLGRDSKAFFPLDGFPLVAYSLLLFESAHDIGACVLVVAEKDLVRAGELCRRLGTTKVTAVVPGGARRCDSVGRGLAALGPDIDTVLVHDGARPFTSRTLVETLAREGASGAVVPVVPATDTIKEIRAGLVLETPDRDRYGLVQTPQGFPRALLCRVYRKPAAIPDSCTDDASLVEACGYPVRVVPGERTNIKITYPEDIVYAEMLLRKGLAARPPVTVNE